MSTAHEHESSAGFSSALFTSVAQDDLEGMVNIYASHSCEAIESRFGMNQAIHSHRPTAFAEEKWDEGSHYFRGVDSSVTGSGSCEFLKCHYVSQTLFDLENMVENNGGSSKVLMGSVVRTNFCGCIQAQVNGRRDSIPYIPEVLKSLRKKPPEVLCPSHSISNPVQQKGQKRQKNLRHRESIGESELECYLYETSMALTNSQPQRSFLVCQRSGCDGNLNRVIKYTLLDNQDGSAGRDDTEKDECVIFDGAIAISTPIGAGLRRGSGGGSGTILHLACAIDSPFALAILLVMGANVSSYHTAFRRSIVHEAACSDSHECLRLLLDIGEGYYESTEFKLTVSNGIEGGDQEASQTCEDSIFARWNNKKRSTPFNSTAFNEGFTDRMESIEKSTEPKDKVGSSYVSTLQIISELIKKMNSNELTSFDAAKSLLSQVPLTKRSSAYIAASCGIRQFSQDVAKLNPDTSRINFKAYSGVFVSSSKRRNPMYDGHGNTPLHWAAFKNACACVDLLLCYHTDPNAVASISGWTPLHDASYSDSAESMKLLISAGADVNAKANSGATPLCFAAQEDAPHATRLLLQAGADAAARCCDHNVNSNDHHPSSRFSGYTPLHYCAHYNAHQAARVLLEMENRKEQSSKLQEIPDLNEKLSIHIAVCRGSSAVLRELLHSGARLNINACLAQPFLPINSIVHYQENEEIAGIRELYSTQHETGNTQNTVNPISSPVLQSMIPVKPITSSKPWNCLSQRSIDECKILLRDAELNWTPERHAIFHPRDRLAVLALLRVGKRLEQMNTGIFLELWPLVLSFCGRGWFEPESSCAVLEHKKTTVVDLVEFSLE